MSQLQLCQEVDDEPQNVVSSLTHKEQRGVIFIIVTLTSTVRDRI